MRGCGLMLPACGVMLLLLLAAAGPVAAQRAAPPPIGSLEDALPTASVAQARGALANSTCALLGCTQCVQVPDRALGGTPTTRCARCDRPFKLANGACGARPSAGWQGGIDRACEAVAPCMWGAPQAAAATQSRWAHAQGPGHQQRLRVSHPPNATISLSRSTTHPASLCQGLGHVRAAASREAGARGLAR